MATLSVRPYFWPAASASAVPRHGPACRARAAVAPPSALLLERRPENAAFLHELQHMEPYLQTGEAKYGMPIIERVITRSTSLNDAAKCVLVSFDSTMRSNLSVGMPIDLICYERDSLEVRMRRRFDVGDAYFSTLSRQWSEGTRRVFSRLPSLDWKARE